MPREVEQVKLVVTPEEKLQIQMNAKAAGKTVSAYIRTMALNTCIFRYDQDKITEHTHEISSLRNAINQLVYTIMKMGDYTPAYLEDICDLMVKVMDSEKKFLQMVDKDWTTKEKLLKKQVKNVVNQRLKNIDNPNSK